MNSNHVSLMSVSQFLRTFFWAPHKGVLLIAFIITLFSALGFVFFGYGLRVLMDGYQDAQYHFSFLVRDVLFLLMALVLTFLLSTYTRIYLLNWVCESGFSKLRVRIFDNILSAPALCLENLEASEITTRFNNDKVILESALSSAVPLAARNTLIGLGSCIFLFTLNVDLTFFFLFWLTVMLLSTLSFRIQLTGVFQAYQKTLTGIGLCVERWVDALLSTRRLYRMCAQKDFLLLSGRSFEVGVKQIVLRLKSLIWASILGFLALIFIFVLGFEEIHQGEMSQGQLASYIFYATMTMSYANGLVEYIIEILQSLGAIKRLAHLVDLKMENTPVTNFVGSGEITLEDVSFYYENKEKCAVVHAFNACFKPYKKIGIVGPPACGKTTLLKVLSGDYAPSKGLIRIAGAQPHLLTKDPVWASSIAVIGDTIPLIPGLLRDHLKMGFDVSDQILLDTASFLEWDINASFPEGLDTVIQTKGNNLSYSQKIYVAFFRALLQRPSFVFWDHFDTHIFLGWPLLSRMLAAFERSTVFIVTNHPRVLSQTDDVLFMNNQEILLDHHDHFLKNDLYTSLVQK